MIALWLFKVLEQIKRVLELASKKDPQISIQPVSDGLTSQLKKMWLSIKVTLQQKERHFSDKYQSPSYPAPMTLYCIYILIDSYSNHGLDIWSNIEVKVDALRVAINIKYVA